MLAQKITFDLMQSKLDDIRVVQGDSCREIQFEGSDLEGVLSYDDYTYEFDLMKSDGTFVIQTMSAGILIPSEQMEVITGTHYYNVKIKDADNELVYSGQGAFIVDDNVITEDAIESVAEVNGLIFPDDFLTVNDHVAFIDDDTVSEDSTWSSQKIQEEIDNNTPVISKTASGNPLTFTDGAFAPLVKCDVTISPIQDLHGYTKPWVGGAGKNKLPINCADSVTNSRIDYTVQKDADNNKIGININGTASPLSFCIIAGDGASNNNINSYSTTVYASGGSIKCGSLPTGVSLNFRYTDGNYDNNVQNRTITLSKNVGLIYLQVDGGVTVNNQIAYPIICASTETDMSYEPYSNICPISGYNAVDVNVAESVLDTPQTYTINLGGTYYSGQIDAVRGVLIATSQMEVFDNTATVSFGRASYDNWYYTISSNEILTESKIPLSNQYVGAPVLNDNNDLGIYKIGSTGQVRVRVGGTKPADTSSFVADLGVNPLQVLYDLPTPIEITLTPEVIISLLGTNTMWTDGDNMSVEYITEPYQPLIDSISQLI